MSDITMLVTHSERCGHLLDSGIADEHLLDGPVSTSSRIRLDGFDNVHTVQHLNLMLHTINSKPSLFTFPNTTCFPSSQEVFTVVMKN